MMQYWLVKSEPDVYPWQRLVQQRKTIWDGVRNFQARNNLRRMKKGDLVLFYHSNIGKEIVGIARVSKAYFPDPTDDSGRWSSVEITPHKAFSKPLPLSLLKTHPILKELVLVKHSRLSVMPVSSMHFERIVQLGME